MDVATYSVDRQATCVVIDHVCEQVFQVRVFEARARVDRVEPALLLATCQLVGRHMHRGIAASIELRAILSYCDFAVIKICTVDQILVILMLRMIGSRRHGLRLHAYY